MLTFFGVSISLHNGMREEIRAISESSRQDIRAISQEMKDFHGRLCSIEERYRERK
jgi:hypothetical protein